jgi:mannonate dehydratase
MHRRDLLRHLTAGGLASQLPQPAAVAQPAGLPRLKITDVKTILTAPPYPDFNDPAQTRLTVVKVLTTEPGLYGVGCASFCFRPAAVAAAIDQYLKPFVMGKDPEDIEDLWKSMYANSLWRSGPVLNNALSGIDMALWDLKAKRAGMPLYQLLGGRSRFAAAVYGHASGRDPAECAESVQKLMQQGYQHVRIEIGGTTRKADSADGLHGMATEYIQDRTRYITEVPKLFEYVRHKCGERVELMHDVHGELPPVDCINMIRRIEPYRPFFIEDPFLPEDVGYFRVLRQQSSAPIAMGEKFVNNQEFVGLVTSRLIDFIRVHISAMGGITKARKIAALCEWFNVRSAWHGPRDVSAIGHAANLHLDLTIPNFGIQERIVFSDAVREVFPGCPEIKDGYMWASNRPGLGIDIDEKAAARYPHASIPGNFGPKRRPDGTIVEN